MRRFNELRDPCSGFTLLETLVSLLLLSLIVAALADGLRFGQRAWSVGRRDQRAGDIESAARAMSGLIGRTLPLAAPDSKGRPALAFFGRRHSLTFVTLSEGATRFAGPALTRIDLRGRRGEAARLRLWTSVFRRRTAWSAPPAGLAPITLADGILSFELSYFGAAKVGAKPRWRADWLGRGRLPKLIAVQLVVRRESRSETISFAVRLHQS